MKLTVQSRHVTLTQAIAKHVRDRLTAALDQHQKRIARVQVMLHDSNGPRGGKDQMCNVRVHLTDGRVLNHKRTDRDMYANISLIADKLKRRLGKCLRRDTDRRKRIGRGQTNL